MPPSLVAFLGSVKRHAVTPARECFLARPTNSAPIEPRKVPTFRVAEKNRLPRRAQDTNHLSESLARSPLLGPEEEGLAADANAGGSSSLSSGGSIRSQSGGARSDGYVRACPPDFIGVQTEFGRLKRITTYYQSGSAKGESRVSYFAGLDPLGYPRLLANGMARTLPPSTFRDILLGRTIRRTFSKSRPLEVDPVRDPHRRHAHLPRRSPRPLTAPAAGGSGPRPGGPELGWIADGILEVMIPIGDDSVCRRNSALLPLGA